MTERRDRDPSSSPTTPRTTPLVAPGSLRTLGALRTLGGVGLEAASVAACDSLRAHPKRLAVLVYLALARPHDPHRRDTLVALFWPESDAAHARGSLRKAVHEIRRALGADAVTSNGEEELGLAPGRVWCDAVAFEDAIAAAQDVDALELYRGDLLPGFFVRDAPGFEDWLERERQRLRTLAADAAQRAAERAERDGDAGHAVRFARRAVALADLDERRLRTLMLLLDRLDDRAAAMQAYEVFARRLASELESEPSAETRALAARLRTRVADVVEEPPATVPPAPRAAPVVHAPPEAPARPRPHARRRIVIGRIVGAIAIVLLPWLPRDSTTTVGEPRWVVVANFDGSDQPLPLVTTAEDIVGVAMRRSGALVVVPAAEIRLAKRSIGVPDTARLTVTLAREIALRGEYDIVVTGSVATANDAYALTVRAVRPDSGSVLATRSGTAHSPDEFIALSRRLGRELESWVARGHRVAGPALQLDSRSWPVTNSFEAYRHFMASQNARDATGSETSPLASLRAAVRLDSTFVEARMALGTVFANLDMLDSARMAYAAVRRHVDPTDLYTITFLDAYDAWVSHDLEGAARAWKVAVARFPWSQRATGNYAVALALLQRYQEAVWVGRMAIAKERGFHSSVTRGNLARALASLGQWEEARRTLTLDGIAPEERSQLYIELATEHWDAAEGVAQLHVNPGRRTETRRRAMVASASLAVLRGDVSQAATLLHTASRIPRVDESRASARGATRALLLLAVASHDTTLLPAAGDDVADDGAPDAGARLLAGLVAAARGDTAGARRARATLRALSMDDAFDLAIGPTLLDAWLLAAAGRTRETRLLLEPALRSHGWSDNAEQTWTLARWLLADAAERDGDLVTAASALEMVINPVEGFRVAELEMRGLVQPYARRRLVALYTRMGRPAEAARHAGAIRGIGS